MEALSDPHVHHAASLPVELVPRLLLVSSSRTSGLAVDDVPTAHEDEVALHLGRPVGVLVRRRKGRDRVEFDVSHD